MEPAIGTRSARKPLLVATLSALMAFGVACDGMTWILRDSCVDGLGIQARFFDITEGIRFPTIGSNVYGTTSDGQRLQWMIPCNKGSVVCFGAEPRGSALGTVSWGMGLDNRAACPAGETCCHICEKITIEKELTCEPASDV